MPGVAGLAPARFALGLTAVFRTTPGLIFFYSSSGEDCSDLAHWWACRLAMEFLMGQMTARISNEACGWSAEGYLLVFPNRTEAGRKPSYAV